MLAKKQKPILYDPLIIPRVKQYLEENVHQTYVDVTAMARTLQERFREYNRRKSGPFRMLVEQAYKTVLHSYGLDSNPSSEDEDGTSELEMMEETATSNHMNNLLTNLYAKNKNRNSEQTAAIATAVTTSKDNPAVVQLISSDESGDESNVNGTTTTPTNINVPKDLSIIKTVLQNKSNESENGQREMEVIKQLNTPVILTPKTLSQPHDDVSQIGKKRKLPSQSTVTNDSKKHNPNLLYIEPNKRTTDSIKDMNCIDQKKQTNLNSQLVTKPRKFKKEIQLENAQYTFQNMGGMEKVLKELCEILFHYRNPQIYQQIGLLPPKGILLHGPSGCGKTMLAEAIAGTLDIPFINVPATELIAGVSGESEERIREIFIQAATFSPCVLFIDEIDAISSNRLYAQKDMERRIVAQLISSLDCLYNYDNGDMVFVIGATNRPDCLDPALRRVGRFDHEIALGIPDRTGREEILRVICEKLVLEPEFNFDKIAEITPGFVGADLFALAFRAAAIAVKRKYFHQMRKQQAESSANIPVVDLLEETTLATESIQDDNTNQTETISNETECEKNLEPNIASESKEEEEEDKDKDATTKPNSEETNLTNEDVEMMDTQTMEESEKPNPIDSTVNNQINQTNDISNTSEEKSKVSAIKTTKKDPSLLELLQWLKGDLLSINLQEADLQDLCLTMVDFQEAVKVVQPSAKREGFVTVPNVTWDDIGSLKNIREELQLAVLIPVKYPERLKVLGLSAPSGILLCGPPGCGKTLLAKAIANEAGINFLSVKGPELMNMYVGESERAVRTCFQRARNSAPCVIFFDEFDSLCPKRTDSTEGGSSTRIVNQLLTEMDGIEDRKGVYLLAATNRPDIIDPAILRPGRLDTVLYVGLPETQDRLEILEALTKKRTKPVLENDVDLNKIAELTHGFTGADLAGLLRQASLLALKDSIKNATFKLDELKVSGSHFDKALSLTKSSVNPKDQKIYEELRLRFAAPRDQ